MIIDHGDEDDQNGPGVDDAQNHDVDDHYCDNSCHKIDVDENLKLKQFYLGTKSRE